jgi:hypothetical protein
MLLMTRRGAGLPSSKVLGRPEPKKGRTARARLSPVICHVVSCSTRHPGAPPRRTPVFSTKASKPGRNSHAVPNSQQPSNQKGRKDPIGGETQPIETRGGEQRPIFTLMALNICLGRLEELTPEKLRVFAQRPVWRRANPKILLRRP